MNLFLVRFYVVSLFIGVECAPRRHSRSTRFVVEHTQDVCRKSYQTLTDVRGRWLSDLRLLWQDTHNLICNLYASCQLLQFSSYKPEVYTIQSACAEEYAKSLYRYLEKFLGRFTRLQASIGYLKQSGQLGEDDTLAPLTNIIINDIASLLPVASTSSEMTSGTAQTMTSRGELHMTYTNTLRGFQEFIHAAFEKLLSHA